MSSTSGDDWRAYLDRFHQERAGVTEALLARAVDASGVTPYDWLAGTVSEHGRVVDLACGSAPL